MRRGVIGHGISTREEAILDREEAGGDAVAIAAELQLGLSYVRKVIAMYRIDASEDRRRRVAARASDGAMTAALAASGGRFA